MKLLKQFKLYNQVFREKKHNIFFKKNVIRLKDIPYTQIFSKFQMNIEITLLHI